MKLVGRLLVLAAVLGLALACGKQAGEAKKEEAKKEEATVKKAEEKKEEAAPAEEKKEEAAPVEEKKEEAAPVEGKKEEAGPKAMTASYAIADLDDTKVKALTLALADKEGVISAKADLEAGLFKVTFTQGTLCPGRIGAALSTVEQNVEFKGMEAADGSAMPDHSGCGGCANKSACGH